MLNNAEKKRFLYERLSLGISSSLSVNAWFNIVTVRDGVCYDAPRMKSLNENTYLEQTNVCTTILLNVKILKTECFLYSFLEIWIDLEAWFILLATGDGLQGNPIHISALHTPRWRIGDALPMGGYNIMHPECLSIYHSGCTFKTTFIY